MSEAATHNPNENYINCSKGIGSWIFTLDHKRIALMYLVAISVALALGGYYAMKLRTELLSPGMDFMSYDEFNQAFTVHGAVMVFLFIIPGIPAVFGNFALPIMLGAKDVAFPRLNLASFHLWIIGCVFFLFTLHQDGLDTGWTFYTPYSSDFSQTSVEPALLGAFILGFSSIFTGLNMMVTVHSLKPKTMGWFKMPLFIWGIYGTAVIQILATPVLGITLLLLLVERTVGIGIFDPAMGGDPVLFQHFFWFYSHPAVYIMILPAMAVISELVSVFSRKPIFGYSFIAYSSIAIAILSFLVWGHHMFVSGQSRLASVIFSLLTFGVAIPSAIKVFNWVATMYKGNLQLDTPMFYVFSFIFLFSIGGLTGIFLGALNVDIHLHDTYFVVAHFHYVMMGGTLIAFLGGLHYWWPKMTGKMYPETLGRIACAGVFLGFNGTFFPQFIAGYKGMPRRYADFAAEFTDYHRLSTFGAYLLGASLLLTLAYLLYSLFFGKKSSANPWGGQTLEWHTPSPPPHYNFDGPTPEHGDPYDFTDWEFVSVDEGYKQKGGNS